MQSGGMVLRRRSTNPPPPPPGPLEAPGSAPPPPRKRVSSTGQPSVESKAKKLRPNASEPCEPSKETPPTQEEPSTGTLQGESKEDKEETLRMTRRTSRRSVSSNNKTVPLGGKQSKKKGGNCNGINNNNNNNQKKEANGEEDGERSSQTEETANITSNGVHEHSYAHPKEETTPPESSSSSNMHLEKSSVPSTDEVTTFVPEEPSSFKDKDGEDEAPLHKISEEQSALITQKVGVETISDEIKKEDDEDEGKKDLLSSFSTRSAEDSPLVNGSKDPPSLKEEDTTPDALNTNSASMRADGSAFDLQVVQSPKDNISAHLSPVFDSSCEVEDVILKEYEENKLAMKAIQSNTTCSDEFSSSQPTGPSDKLAKKSRTTKRQAKVVVVVREGEGREAVEASKVSSEPPKAPVKRLLRSKTLNNSKCPPKEKSVEPMKKKKEQMTDRKVTRKPRAKNGKRIAKKKTGVPPGQSNKSLNKVKSACDQENNVASDHSSEEPLVPLKGSKGLHSGLQKEDEYIDLKALEAVKEEINDRLKSFEHIKENVFLCERRSNKQSRGMECDCSLSKEEVSSNKKGCGENCLNRLLKIECSKLCSLGKLCGNKKFQSSDNAPVEVFKTNCKGFGVRATSYIPGDTFIMEYVGEVLDAKQFRKRAKRYAKDDVRHFYFMALSTEFCIDAGSKGNISRFINHSCSPNSETQKWMVDGEMRIGFFTKRRISAGEEITFDYKYERYGQEAQKCLCEAENCRGWLGGEPGNDEDNEDQDEDDDLEEDDYWSTSEEECASEEERSVSPLTQLSESVPPVVVVPEEPNKIEDEESKDKDYVLQVPSITDVAEEGTKDEGPPKKRKRRRRSPRKIKNYEDVEDEDEIERLKSTGIRTKNHTVELSRIMVRTTDTNSRSILAELLLNADTPCKRLFLDYYGLKILYGWMSENIWSNLHELDLKIQILNILALLGIPHKTMLVDCKVWSIVNSWANGELGDAVSEDNSDATNSGSASPVNNADQLSDHIQESCPPQSEKAVSPHKKDDSPLQTLPSSPTGPPSPESCKQVEESLNEQKTEKEEEEKESLDTPAIVDSSSTTRTIEEEKMISEEPSKEKEIQKTLSEQPILKEEVFETDIKPITKVECQSEDSSLKTIEEIDSRCKVIISKSKDLIESWKTLKEVFKIPKKDRIALRAEHEREADQAANQCSSSSNAVVLPPVAAKSSAPLVRNTISTIIMNNACISIPPSGVNGAMSNGCKSYFATPGRSLDVPVNKRLCSRWDDRSGRLHRSKLSREERRQLFALQVKTQEEEKKKRELLLEHHRNKCFYLNLPADETPMFPHYPDFVFNPEDGNWYQMPEPYPKVHVNWGYANMANLPSEAYREGDEPLPDRAYLYPPGVVPISYLYGIPLTTPEDYYKRLEEQQLAATQSEEAYLAQQQIQQPITSIPTVPPEMDDDDDTSSDVAVGVSSKLKRPDDVPKLEEEEGESSSPMPFPIEHHKSNDLQSAESKILSEYALDPDLPPPKTPGESPAKPNTLSAVSSSASSSHCREITIRLPPQWKMALDPSGMVYFYNNSTKSCQWDPPPSSDLENTIEDDCSELIVEMETLSTDSEEEENGEEDKEGGEDSEDEEEDESDEEGGSSVGGTPQRALKGVGEDSAVCSDLSEKEKEILLNLTKEKTKEERQHERRQKRERDREKREYERKRRRERHGKHRRDGLVQEFFIPGRSDSEKREVLVNREAKEKARDKQIPMIDSLGSYNRGLNVGTEKKMPGSESNPSSSSAIPSNPTAPSLLSSSTMDSEKEKKYKDRFLKEASKVIVKVLDPYRRSDVHCGQIKSVEDFKHLARKLTNFVMTKELKHCPKIEDLKCSESVKKKAAEFVKKYMSKFGGAYKRSPSGI